MNCSMVSMGRPDSRHFASYFIFCCSISPMMSFSYFSGRIFAWVVAGVIIDDYCVWIEGASNKFGWLILFDGRLFGRVA
jgi:hypothetical protein